MDSIAESEEISAVALEDVKLLHETFSKNREISAKRVSGRPSLSAAHSRSISRQNSIAADKDRILVAVRVRPFNEREIDLKSRPVIWMAGRSTFLLQRTAEDSDSSRASPSTGLSYQEFCFDRSYFSFNLSEESKKHLLAQFKTSKRKQRKLTEEPLLSTQESIFADIGVMLLDNLFQAYSSTLIAYGQTGSGKTYSTLGGDLEGDERGLLPRISEALFQKRDGIEQGNPNQLCVVTASYMELYDERIYDLLTNSSSSNRDEGLRVREHPRTGPFIEHLVFASVNNCEDVATLIEQGNKKRATAATLMNERSSRSHAIFTFRFTHSFTDAEGLDHERTSSLRVVDLAGSERQDTAGISNNSNRLAESRSINLSLSVLGRVINELAKTGESHAFRDSKLTFLLRSALGGNSKSVMLATLSPSDGNWAQTLSTLKYARRAKHIPTKPVVNEDPVMTALTKLRKENEELKSILRRYKGERNMVRRSLSALKTLSERKQSASVDNNATSEAILKARTESEQLPQKDEKESIEYTKLKELLKQVQTDLNLQKIENAKLKEQLNVEHNMAIAEPNHRTDDEHRPGSSVKQPSSCCQIL